MPNTKIHVNKGRLAPTTIKPISRAVLSKHDFRTSKYFEAFWYSENVRFSRMSLAKQFVFLSSPFLANVSFGTRRRIGN